MKKIKFVLLTLSFITLSSCIFEETNYYNDNHLNDLLKGYDLWYIESFSSDSNSDVPFLSRAFTISFVGTQIYANNNISGIGYTGNGLGVHIGSFQTSSYELLVNHSYEGSFDLEVMQISSNVIEIYDHYSRTTYYLTGHSKNYFDYDSVFYDNIEYFLQEYGYWEKTKVNSVTTDIHEFDYENYLQFSPEEGSTFRSSTDDIKINSNNIIWDYIGDYEVFDVTDYDDLKILSLNYGSNEFEEFELTILDDKNIELYHIDSETIYEFRGRDFIQYKVKNKALEQNSGRKRVIYKRKEIERKRKQG